MPVIDLAKYQINSDQTLFCTAYLQRNMKIINPLKKILND